MSEIGRIYFILIAILVFVVALHDQNIILLFFAFFTIRIVHLIIVFIRLVAKIVRELKADRCVLEWSRGCNLRIHIVLLDLFHDEIRRALRGRLWLLVLLRLYS